MANCPTGQRTARALPPVAHAARREGRSASTSSRRILVFAASLILACATAHAQSIATFAGGIVGDGGVAGSASLNSPQGIAVDTSGNVYVADFGNNRVRRIDGATGVITTIAGTGISGFAGDGGLASAAQIRLPRGLATDSGGNLYVVDAGNQRIRKIALGSGIISTVAGNGASGFSGDGAAATSASLNNPRGISVDTAGNLFIADTDNNRIRKVAAGTGIITTVAGNGTAGYSGDGAAATSAALKAPFAVALDPSGNLFIADTDNVRVRKVAAATAVISTVAGNGVAGFAGDGAAGTAAALDSPRGLVIDASGNLYVADSDNFRVRRVAAATGIITTTAGNGTPSFSGDGGAATAAGLQRATFLALDAAQNLLIADIDNGRVRKVASGTGTISTLAGGGTFVGDGGNATAAVLSSPQGIAVDGSGNVYFSDQGNQRIRKIVAASGVVTTLAGIGVTGYSGDGAAASSARLANPEGLAIDASGNLYVADTVNHRVRKIAAATGVITTVAGNGAFGFSGDGVAATSASLYFPTGVALDSGGNLFVADWGNQRIRRVASGTGIITTVAGNGSAGFGGDGAAAVSATLNFPRNLAIDASGNIYVADTGNHRIRKIALAGGVISTVAGTGVAGYNGDGIAATTARLNDPIGVAIDSGGNVLVADTLNQRIRRIASGTGVISTIAGNGSLGFSGDGGAATAASVYNPFAIALAAGGKLYFPESGNQRIRRVSPTLPAAPTIGVATAGNAQASIAFSAPGVDGGSPITGYVVSCNPGAVSMSGAASPLTVAGLVNGTTYTCTVAATNAVGTGPPSGASNTFTPQAATTTTALTSSANPSAFAQGVTFTATVSGSAPTGTVTFKDGAAPICQAVTLVNARAQCTTASLAAGAHSVTASYSGDATNKPSASPALAQSITGTLPGAPTSVSAYLRSNGILVAFAPPASTGSSPITSYTVTCNPGNVTATGPASPILVGGLSLGSTYTCTVRATNSAGSGAASSPSNSVTYRLVALRTFVASYGNDAASCGATDACRTLARALSLTAAGGEVVALDSADYGAATISQAVSVIAAPGVYAGISAPAGGNGLTIAAGAGDTVILRGLSITSAGGNNGVLFSSGAALYVESTSVRGFAAAGAANIAFQPSDAAKLFINDSYIQSGTVGLKLASAGGAVDAIVANSRFDGNGNGVLANAEGLLVLRNVVIAGGSANGVSLAGANGHALTATVERSSVVDNAAAGITAGGTSPVIATVKRSSVQGNGTYGVYAQGGAIASIVRIDRSVITRNGTGLATGAGGSILSRGNNTIEANANDGAASGGFGGR